MLSDATFEAFLGQKYAAINKNADAAESQASAANMAAGGRAALDQAQADVTPGNAAAQQGLLGAQAGEARARGNYLGVQSSLEPGRARADNAFKLGGAGLFGATLGGYGSLPDFLRPTPLQPPSGNGLGNYHTGATSIAPATPGQLAAFHAHLLHAKAGVTRIPGKGPSTVDTVPAMLAPREAVLNEHAADLIGRDKIATANAIGVAHQKMQPGKGMPAPKGTGPAPAKAAPPHQKLAGGSHMVGHGKSAKTPAKIDPQALMSLLGSMQGGQPGGGASAPMANMPAPGGMV